MRTSTAVSYVRGEDLEPGDALAQIPPLRNRTSIRLYGKQLPGIKQFYIEGTVRFAAKQDRVSPSASVSPGAEKPTGRYLVGDGGLGLRFAGGSLGFAADVFVRVNNIGDTAYRDHLSSVEDMGRTVKLGLVIDY